MSREQGNLGGLRLDIVEYDEQGGHPIILAVTSYALLAALYSQSRGDPLRNIRRLESTPNSRFILSISIKVEKK